MMALSTRRKIQSENPKTGDRVEKMRRNAAAEWTKTQTNAKKTERKDLVLDLELRQKLLEIEKSPERQKEIEEEISQARSRIEQLDKEIKRLELAEGMEIDQEEVAEQVTEETE
jgi:5-bromo-4-chloroindolyl phosphate hydrolysis protein